MLQKLLNHFVVGMSLILIGQGRMPAAIISAAEELVAQASLPVHRFKYLNISR